MKIACDNQISTQVCRKLFLRGYDIVFRANDEPDDVWIEEALKLGATVFISPDLDIPNYLDKQAVECKWIDVKQGLSGVELADYLLEELKELRIA